MRNAYNLAILSRIRVDLAKKKELKNGRLKSLQNGSNDANIQSRVYLIYLIVWIKQISIQAINH